jgi:hypothetical protein
MPFSPIKEIDRLLNLRSRDGFAEQADFLLDAIGCKFNRVEGENEFSWVASYVDGKEIRQFEPDGTEHHFGHIDLSRLSILAWFEHQISPEAEVRDRLYLTLDIETGLFNTNMEIPEELFYTMNEFAEAVQGKKKVILYTNKNHSFHPELGEITYYRYYLGWETEGKNKEKRLICIRPNGVIERVE